MQNVLCKITKCPFCSKSGFCLNRLVTIDQGGMCKWIQKHPTDTKIEDWQKSNYKKPEKAIERIEGTIE